MYAYRYHFDEFGASVELGLWQADRWPDEEQSGGFVFGSTASIHIARGQHGPAVSVNVGSTNLPPAAAALRAKVYLAAAQLGQWIEQRLSEGATIPEVGAAVEQLVPNYAPVEELV